MSLILGIFAIAIALFYSLYFSRIIKGNPEGFESELLQALANWIIIKGSSSRRSLVVMLLLSFIIEGCYFLLVFEVIDNIFMLIFTGIFVAFEVFHLLSFGFSLKNFFHGNKKLKYLFNWRVERVSTLAFFTHSLLVLVCLIIN
ncbi:MAG: hypothetical protein ACOX6E_03735 [Syntrophomonadaceae bacterium]